MAAEGFQIVGCCYRGDDMDGCGENGAVLLDSHRTLILVGQGTVGDHWLLVQMRPAWWMRCPVAESWVLLAQMKKRLQMSDSNEVEEVMARVGFYAGDCMEDVVLVLSHHGMSLQEWGIGHHSAYW